MNDPVQNQPAIQSQPQVVGIGQKMQANLLGRTRAQNQSMPVSMVQDPKSQNLSTDTVHDQQGQAISTQTQPLVQSQNSSQGSLQTQDVDDTGQNLDTFEEVLDEIQNTVPHGIVQAVDQATDTLNPQSPARSAKESLQPLISPDSQNIDIGGGVQTVEYEKNPEIPVEVESFLQRVEDHQETAPTEVVIADGTSEIPTNKYPSRPVIVLPITKQEEEEGIKKSPKFSFRWLVEFSHKVIKMFTGKVIYRQEN